MKEIVFSYKFGKGGMDINIRRGEAFLPVELSEKSRPLFIDKRGKNYQIKFIFFYKRSDFIRKVFSLIVHKKILDIDDD